jgi:LDH2 family malate/lactate/ureidoglycolate dehydrogenase
MQVSIARLRETVHLVLTKYGRLSDENATIIGEHLMDGELGGRTAHGLVRVARIARECRDLRMKPIRVVRETPVSALIDGGGSNGILVAYQAMQIAIAKAKTSGIAFAGGSHCTGVGMAGYHARQALPHHLIGIACVNSEARVAPFGTTRPVMGTNPLAIAIPAVRKAIVADFATASTTFGEIILAQKLGKPIEPGLMIDRDGNPTTNPDDLDGGAILPIAGHKGSALSVAIEVLAGPLVAAKAGLTAVTGSGGFLFGALDPTILVPRDEFESQVQALIDEISAAPAAPGFTIVQVPGERSAATRRRNLATGMIEVADELWSELSNLIE